MKFQRKILVSAIIAASSATILSITSLVWAAPELNITLDSNSMITTATIATAADGVYVRIAGPNGYFIELTGADVAQWNPGADAPDGSYRYDSYTTVETPQGMSKQEVGQKTEKSSSRKSGTFTVEGGVIVPPQEVLDEDKKQSSTNSKGALEKILISVLDIIIPTANAADVTVSGNAPWLRFDDTNTAGLEWLVRGYTDYWRLYDYHTSSGISSPMMSFDHSANSTKSMMVDTSGDITFADSSVFIDRSADKVGIGTTTPITTLDVLGSTALVDIGLKRAGAYPRWELETGGSWFGINEDNGGNIFIVDSGANSGSLVVDTTSNIGIGTTSPIAGLHVKKSNGTARVRVEETHATTAKRFQLDLVNNGGTGFLMTDTSVAGRQWQFATLSNGSFTASYLNSGGPELQILNDGRVTMGPGSTTNFNLVSGGNLYIPHGSVTATNFITSSSHAVKKDFEKVNADDLMNKLQNLEVTKWRYKDPEVKGHHIGPMAEDFYKLFELGPDNKHVVATDMAGIALIAAKKLQEKADLVKADTLTLKKENARLIQKTATLEDKTAALKVENNKLQERLASLEKLVTTLASSTKNLDSSGDKVALK